jgi:hypothetical protein
VGRLVGLCRALLSVHTFKSPDGQQQQQGLARLIPFNAASALQQQQQYAVRLVYLLARVAEQIVAALAWVLDQATQHGGDLAGLLAGPRPPAAASPAQLAALPPAAVLIETLLLLVTPDTWAWLAPLTASYNQQQHQHLSLQSGPPGPLSAAPQIMPTQSSTVNLHSSSRHLSLTAVGGLSGAGAAAAVVARITLGACIPTVASPAPPRASSSLSLNSLVNSQGSNVSGGGGGGVAGRAPVALFRVLARALLLARTRPVVSEAGRSGSVNSSSSGFRAYAEVATTQLCVRALAAKHTNQQGMCVPMLDLQPPSQVCVM